MSGNCRFIVRYYFIDFIIDVQNFVISNINKNLK